MYHCGPRPSTESFGFVRVFAYPVQMHGSVSNSVRHRADGRNHESWFGRYSYLSACTGFTRDARRAGRYAARNVTASTIGMTMSIAIGSRSSLPDGKPARRHRPAPTLAARPTINPTT